MNKRKNDFAKTFISSVKKIFHARNIIIISDHKVDHVPLSGTLQILLCIGILGLFSGSSYIIGSYMTARSAIHERDEKIALSAKENDRVSGEMVLLRQDMARLSQASNKLSDYNKFIASQYESVAGKQAMITTAADFSGALAGQSSEKLLERIAYLESRVGEEKEENERLVLAIRERTDKKIDFFEDIISMTGLNAEHLEHVASVSARKHISLLPRSERSVSDPAEDTAEKQQKTHNENAGGPFIPYDEAALNDSDRELLENVDRLMLLHDIVQKLPLSQPLRGAQPASPFGRRLDPFNGRWAMHPGLDLVGPIGAHIYSASSGKIVGAGHKIAYGNMVDIDHGFGIVTRYAHLSKILVKEGDIVHKGQLIGIQGSTGRSTGPHLHYEVRINDRPVNPAKFLRAGNYVLQN